MAFWMAGSLARGVTVATYRSVLVTWLRVQMAATDSGASTQATTIRRVATIDRQRWRPTRPARRGRLGVAAGRALLAHLGAEGGVLGPQPLQLGALLRGQGRVLGHG